MMGRAFLISGVHATGDDGVAAALIIINIT
jgi:hypothetical protein